MEAKWDGPIRIDKRLPLTLKVFSPVDGKRKFDSFQFDYFLLDDSGRQIGHRLYLSRSAVGHDVDLSAKESTYKPDLTFPSYSDEIAVGRKYQLVCVLRPCGLMTALWFTLEE